MSVPLLAVCLNKKKKTKLDQQKFQIYRGMIYGMKIKLIFLPEK